MGLTIEQALLKAVESHKAGRLQDAERLYRVILQAQPKQADANHNLGVLAISVNMPDVALPLFKTALEANPSQAQFWISYIDALIKEKQFDNARHLLSEGKKAGLEGEGVEALEAQLATSLLEQSSKTSSTNEVSTFSQERKKVSAKKDKKKNSLSNQTSFNQARNPSLVDINTLIEHYQTGRYDLAEKLAEDLIQKYPDHQLGWKVLGAVFKQTGRLEDSLIANQRSVDLSPNDAKAYYNLGNTLKDLHRHEEAEASYKKAISISPDYFEAYGNLGTTLIEVGRVQEAEYNYKKAIEVKPEYAEAYNNLGVMLYELGKLEDAESIYNKAIAIRPCLAEAHNNLGVTLEKLGRLKDAETSYKKAIAIKPDYAEALLNFGMLSLNFNQIDDSIKILEKVTEIDDDYIKLKATVTLAIIKFLRDDLNSAALLIDNSKKILKIKNELLTNEATYHVLLNNLILWHLVNCDSPNDQFSQTLYVIGESHALSSHGLCIKKLNGGSMCKVNWIQGCKQWHLGNSIPNKYKQQFERVIYSLPYEATLLVSIGEIDCRTNDGILKHIKNYPSKVQSEVVRLTIDNYLNYVHNLTSTKSISVFIQGIPCPNLDRNKVEKNELLKLINLIKEFNGELREKSKEMGFEFLNLHLLTDRGDGYSNGIWNIDEYHLSPAGMLKAWESHFG